MSRSRRALVGTTFIGALAAGRGSRAATGGASAAGTPTSGGAIDVTAFGAVGDGRTDDSEAIAAACNFAIAQFSRGNSCFLQFPSGLFLIKRTKIPMFKEAPIGVRGNGPSQTILVIDATYQGDVFSWSNCWDRSSYGSKTLGKLYNAGAYIEDIAFRGTRDRDGITNALGFYGINDNVRVHNIQFDYVLGHAILIGAVTDGMQIGIMRESRFSEIRIFCSGTEDCPCIDIGSTGTSDATNELIFSQIDIFLPGGHGMVVRNSGLHPVRLMKMFGLRIEKFPAGFCGLQIGDEATDGAIYGLNIIGIELISGHLGSKALALIAKSDKQIEACYFQGQIINCDGDGVFVTAGYCNKIDLMRNDSHQVGLTLRKTTSPLYYSCPGRTSMSIAPECKLLIPTYSQYHL